MKKCTDTNVMFLKGGYCYSSRPAKHKNQITLLVLEHLQVCYLIGAFQEEVGHKKMTELMLISFRFRLYDFPTFCHAHLLRGEVYTQLTSQLAYNQFSRHISMMMLRIDYYSSHQGDINNLCLGSICLARA